MKNKPIRELGGELWAELSKAKELQLALSESSLSTLDFHAINQIVDLVMAVLAGYDGQVITNDVHRPVQPLSKN